MRLFIVRHAETVSNRGRLIQGRQESPISDAGKTQLKSLTDEFAGVPIDLIFSSQLGRAYETAKAIAGARIIPIRQEIALNERAYGEWEGKDFDEMLKEKGNLLAREPPLDFTTRPLGGESLQDVADRALPFIDSIVKNPKNSQLTVAIVSHGVVIKLILAHLIDKDVGKAYKYRNPNAAATELLLTGKEVTVARLCDTSHLAKA